jgi:hypothetical protein
VTCIGGTRACRGSTVVSTKNKLSKCLLRRIERDLIACRQTLMCAAEALGAADYLRPRCLCAWDNYEPAPDPADGAPLLKVVQP